MQQQIEPISFAANFAEKIRDISIVRNIARMKRRPFAELADELLDVLLQALALIVKNQFCARGGPGFGNRPGDAALVRHAEDDASFSGQNLWSHRADDTHVW